MFVRCKLAEDVGGAKPSPEFDVGGDTDEDADEPVGDESAGRRSIERPDTKKNKGTF